MNAKLTQGELQAIKERVEKTSFEKAYLTGDPWKGYEVKDDGNGIVIAEVSCGTDAEFLAKAPQDVTKLLAEIERLQAEVHEHSAHNGHLIATHVIPTKEENKRLRKALEFYANVDNYGYTANVYEINEDNGKIAREALK